MDLAASMIDFFSRLATPGVNWYEGWGEEEVEGLIWWHGRMVHIMV